MTTERAVEMYGPDRDIAQRLVDTLNEALRLDPDAIEALCSFAVSCNDPLADHPLITVSEGPIGGPSVRLIGLLQGVTRSRRIYEVWETVCPVHGPMDETQVGRECPAEGCEETIRCGHLLKFGVY